jgi:hypothetical protein
MLYVREKAGDSGCPTGSRAQPQKRLQGQIIRSGFRVGWEGTQDHQRKDSVILECAGVGQKCQHLSRDVSRALLRLEYPRLKKAHRYPRTVSYLILLLYVCF